jgi:hypothetical protein
VEFVTVFAGLAAAVVAIRRSPARAFLDVYIPVLLLLPMTYRWVLPVVPDPTFEQAAIIPIAVVYFLRRHPRWEFTVTDGLVFGLSVWMVVSEFVNVGHKEAQNILFDTVCTVVLPYVLTKALIEPLRLRTALARRIVILLFAVCIISIYEFRMGQSAWAWMGRLFPGQGTEWYTTFRFGFTRVAGPYAHAILAGLVLMIGYRLQRWLEWSGGWGPTFRLLPWAPISKARTITLALLAGILMTLVRGPWLGGILGAVLTNIGRARNRERAMLWVLACGVLLVVPAAMVLRSYVSVGRAGAITETQETAAYRAELVDKYVAIAEKKMIWGYGRNTWPKIHTAPSIDNHYLLLWLMHGIGAVVLLVAIFGVVATRLVRTDMRLPAPPPSGSSFGFTLAGIYLALFVTIATAYMGLQAIPLFAILTGWSDGYLLRARETEPMPVLQLAMAGRQFAFRRVVT